MYTTRSTRKATPEQQEKIGEMLNQISNKTQDKAAQEQIYIQFVIQKAIEVAGPEILKQKTLLCNILEDLAPWLERDRKFIERIYSDELGGILFRAYQAQLFDQNALFAEARKHLEQVDQFQEKCCDRIMDIFEISLRKAIITDPEDDEDTKRVQKSSQNGKEPVTTTQKTASPAGKSRSSVDEIRKELIERNKKLGKATHSQKLSYQFYQAAADMGDAESQFIVGYMNEYGEGVAEKNLKLAAEYYRKAADQGHRGAQHNLGVFYYLGTGVKKDLHRAHRLFSAAAQQGKGDSMRNLGVMYETGKGVAKNLLIAAKWYRDAVNAGNQEAEEDQKRVLRMIRNETWNKISSPQ